MTGGLRVRAGLALAFVAGIGALLLASSPPTFPSWVAHLVALEFSLALSAAAALALVVSAGAHTRAADVTRIVAVPALVVGLIPALVAIPS